MKFEDAVTHLERGHAKPLVSTNPEDGSRVIFFTTEEGYHGGALIGISSLAQDPSNWSLYSRTRLPERVRVEGYIDGYSGTGDLERVSVSESWIKDFEDLSEVEVQLGQAALESYLERRRKQFRRLLEITNANDKMAEDVAKSIDSADLPSEIGDAMKEFFAEPHNGKYVNPVIAALIQIRSSHDSYIDTRKELDSL